MHCRACDKLLSNTEAVIKNRNGEYEDMCLDCLGISNTILESSDDLQCEFCINLDTKEGEEVDGH